MWCDVVYLARKKEKTLKKRQRQRDKKENQRKKRAERDKQKQIEQDVKDERKRKILEGYVFTPPPILIFWSAGTATVLINTTNNIVSTM